MKPRKLLITVICVASWSSVSDGAITTYTDFAQWQSAVGTFTTIGFADHPTGTIVTTQYVKSGVVFPDGNDFILSGFPLTFPQDGAGLRDIFTGIIRVSLSTPHAAIGVHHPGTVTFRLFLDGQVVGEDHLLGGGGINFFSAVSSTTPFDFVMMFDEDGVIDIDNLYLGPAVPAPGAFGLFAVAGLVNRRRR